jgi:hypothetical protein
MLKRLMPNADRAQLLRDCIERQMAAKAKLERELVELDEAMQDTLREWMDLVCPKPPVPICGQYYHGAAIKKCILPSGHTSACKFEKIP